MSALREDLIRLRRDSHRFPEVGLYLPRTQRRVYEELQDLPLEISTGTALSSITAVLRGGRPGPVVLLRGDMDALPVTERTGLPYASEIEGAMHACGHDPHTAGLVGAARLLCERREESAGDVVFMFQPGEEGFGGAEHMINEGVLEAAGRPVDAAYALHVYSSRFPNGMFTSRPGTQMAAMQDFSVRVIGEGGHASTPHMMADPIPVACEMVTVLQTMITRRFDIFDPVVLTVGTIHAGTRSNVIPADARFSASVRSFSLSTRSRLAEAIPRLCAGIAEGHGFEVEVEIVKGYPETRNDAREYEHLAETVQDVFGVERFTELEKPSVGSEDFSFVLERVPGAFVCLGAAAESDYRSAASNHSATAVHDDSVLLDGARLLAELAVRRMERDQEPESLGEAALAG